MTNLAPWKLLVLAFTSFLAVIAVQQNEPSDVSPATDRKEVADFSKSVQLYRSICLQEFDDDLAESVYGMHGQQWIVDKLKIDDKTPIFLSMGYSPDSFGNPWLAPDPALIKAISSDRVRSVGDAKASNIVVIVENVDWETSTAVCVAISTYHQELGMIHGSMDVRLKFSENRWIVTEQGGCRIRKFEDR